MPRDNAGFTVADAPEQPVESEAELLVNPDMSVLRLGRRAPPSFPLATLGSEWASWVVSAADAAACHSLRPGRQCAVAEGTSRMVGATAPVDWGYRRFRFVEKPRRGLLVA